MLFRCSRELIEKMATFNIYVASYNRAKETTTYKHVEYCTYVVRKSQEEEYKQIPVKTLAVEDEKINSFAKVQNWLIDNAPEDVICVLDDDIIRFVYVIDKRNTVRSPEIVTAEFERMAQIVEDLDIPLLGIPIVADPRKYSAEFKFSGVIGPMRIYNRKLIKARYEQMPFFGDTDFVLQELLLNRIVLRPCYLASDAKIEVNKGGMNLKRTKMMQEKTYKEILKPKWGKYVTFNTKSNVTNIRVKR